jgi:hypothetical protein
MSVTIHPTTTNFLSNMGCRMSKRLGPMRRNALADRTIGDAEAVRHGVVCAPSHSGSSHCKVAHLAIAEILTVSFKPPISQYISANWPLSSML